MPKRSPKHPEDNGKPIPSPLLYAGDPGGEAYRVVGRDGWPSIDVLPVWLSQDWDNAVGDTTGGSDRRAGVIRHQVIDGRVVKRFPAADFEFEESDSRRKSHTGRIRLGNPVGMEEVEPVGPGEAMIEALDAAMATLTDRQREVMEMFALGWSERRIADAIGSERPNVQQHKALAVRKLRAALNTIQP